MKLSGDGTVIGKRLHCVVFAFTILEENSTGSVDGIHPIALFRDSEKYESVKLALADLIDEMKDTDVITVDGETFRIIYSLGGDYKFLSMVTGIDSANCKYACIWCKCPKDSRWITDKTWDSRTAEENELLSSKSKKSFNVTNPPLFPFIPLQNVVIDNLHLFLRVTDVLVDLLLAEVIQHDATSRGLKLTQVFEAAVSNLSIPAWNFYSEGPGRLKWRSFTGPEKLKLFSGLKLCEVMPNGQSERVACIQSLWDRILAINNLLK